MKLMMDLFITHTVIAIFICSTNCYKVAPTLKPKVWLESYQERDSFVLEAAAVEFRNTNQYENRFASKNGSEYVISSETSMAVFLCEADYPITWKLPNPEQFSGVTSFHLRVRIETSSDFEESFEEPLNSKFFAYLEITTLDYQTVASLSGNLACQMVNNPAVQSSIYVYTEVYHPLFNTDEVINVNVTESSTTVILPCRPVLPSMSMSLFKRTFVGQNISGNSSWSWDPMYLNASINFDPRVGFILDNNTLQDIYGQYKCVVDGEEDVMHTFLRVAPGTQSSYEFIPKSTTSKSSKVIFGRGFVTCCTGKVNSSTYGDSFDCANEAECDLLKPVYMHDLLTGRRVQQATFTFATHAISFKGKIGVKTTNAANTNSCYQTPIITYQKHHHSMLFLCSGSGIDVTGQFITGFDDDSTLSTLKRNPKLQQLLRIRRRFRPQFQYQVFDLNHNNMSISNKIHFEIEAPLLNLYPIDLYRYSGVNQALPNSFAKIGIHYRYAYYRPNRPYYAPIYRGHLYEGESLLVTCMTHPYFYAKGGWLRLNWKNGSRTVFSQGKADDLLLGGMDINFDSLARLQAIGVPDAAKTDYIRGRPPVVSLEMESLDCFAPVWNTNKWEKHTYKMKVQVAALPDIDSFPSESVALKINQTGFQINCTMRHTLQSIFVPAVLYWEKDGKILQVIPGSTTSITAKFVGNCTVSTLSLLSVTHVTQGEYSCVAKNLKGSVRKTIKIFVDDDGGNGGKIVVVSGFCVSILGAIILALVGRHWHLRRDIARILAT